jgi:hypothetical protein
VRYVIYIYDIGRLRVKFHTVSCGAARAAEHNVHSHVSHRDNKHASGKSHCSAVLPPGGTTVKADCHVISVQTKDTQTILCLCEIHEHFSCDEIHEHFSCDVTDGQP